MREIPDPPPLLYVKGDLACADYQRTVAIVGTRRITAYGKQVTAQLAGTLARAGICVVSGMAAGIDGEAHRAALDAEGATVAVWGTGLHEIYPRANRRLVPRILERGAIVTEYPVGMRGLPENFPQRNRIISGLSLATIIVEAPLESGALHTARYAIEQNREILAVPGSVFAAASRGTNRLINRGEARAVTSAEDVLEALQIAVSPEQLEMPQLVKPTTEERAVLRHLTTDPSTSTNWSAGGAARLPRLGPAGRHGNQGPRPQPRQRPLRQCPSPRRLTPTEPGSRPGPP